MSNIIVTFLHICVYLLILEICGALKCNRLDGFSSLDSESIYYPPLSSNQSNLEDCCTACDSWTGTKPCAGYFFDTETQICTLKSKLGQIFADSTSQIVIGHPAIQKFQLIAADHTFESLTTLEEHSTVSPHICSYYCLLHLRCRAFVIDITNQVCQLTVVTSQDAMVGILPSNNKNIYEIKHNEERKNPCHTEQWTAWSSPICFYGNETRSRNMGVESERNCPVAMETAPTICPNNTEICDYFDSIGGPTTPIVQYSKAIGGNAIRHIQVSGISQCKCACKMRLNCFTAAFSKSGLCSLHSKTSNEGTFINANSAIIDLQITSERILIIGGETTSGGPSDQIVEFNPDLLTFTTMPIRLQTARHGHVAAMSRNKIIIDGGTSAPSMEIFTGVPLVGSMSPTAKRSNGCGGMAYGKLYHCFGSDSGLLKLTNCAVYGPKPFFAPPEILETDLTTGRSGAACTVIDDHMYVFGGNSWVNQDVKMDLLSGQAVRLRTNPCILTRLLSVVSRGYRCMWWERIR